MYAEFIDTVREVNRKLTPGNRMRVLLGNQPAGNPRQRNEFAVSLLGDSRAVVVR